MTLYDWLLLVHIIAAMIWVGGSILLLAIAARMARADDLNARLTFTRESDVAGPIIAASVWVLLAAGIGMVIESEVWEFSQLWIWLSLTLFAVSGFVGGAYYGRANKRMVAALESGEPGRAEADRLARQTITVARVDVLLLLVIVGLMVFKPGG